MPSDPFERTPVDPQKARKTFSQALYTGREEAKDALEEAEVFSHVAKEQQKAGFEDDAMATLKELEKLADAHDKVYASSRTLAILGKAFAEIGKPEEAKEAFAKALKVGQMFENADALDKFLLFLIGKQMEAGMKDEALKVRNEMQFHSSQSKADKIINPEKP